MWCWVQAASRIICGQQTNWCQRSYFFFRLMETLGTSIQRVYTNISFILADGITAYTSFSWVDRSTLVFECLVTTFQIWSCLNTLAVATEAEDEETGTSFKPIRESLQFERSLTIGVRQTEPLVISQLPPQPQPFLSHSYCSFWEGIIIISQINYKSILLMHFCTKKRMKNS